MLKQRGVSLIEVLIAVLIATVGLLGFAALQARALGSTEESYARSQAAAIAQDMIERVRSNMGGETMKRNPDMDALREAYADADAWASGSGGADCISASCTAVEMAAFDIDQVRAVVGRMLPNGSALIVGCGENAQLCAAVAWGDATATSCAENDGIGAQCVLVQGL